MYVSLCNFYLLIIFAIICLVVVDVVNVVVAVGLCLMSKCNTKGRKVFGGLYGEKGRVNSLQHVMVPKSLWKLHFPTGRKFSRFSNHF